MERLKEGNISLVLDDYEFIFSDFDPRPYSERALSDDFLNECRKAALGKNTPELELRLLVPRRRRSAKSEEQILARLRSHFQKHNMVEEKVVKDSRRTGFLWVVAGVLLSLGAMGLLEKPWFLAKLLFIIMEPAGWFSFWTGFDKLFFSTKERKGEYEFYRRMAGCKISFYSS